MSSENVTTPTATDPRIEALARYLGVGIEDVTSGYGENSYEVGRETYWVLTDAEADDLCADQIKDQLWAFRASFIASHTRNGLNSQCIRALEKMQGELCEDAGPIIEALIEDMDRFISDAISADGRGHFLASYDGDEHESGEFFIYRD